MNGISHFGFVAPYRPINGAPPTPTALQRCEQALEAEEIQVQENGVQETRMRSTEATHYENKASWNHRISVIKAVAFVAIAIAAFALCGVFGVGGIIISLVAAGCLIGAGLLYKFSIEKNLQEKREAKEIAKTLTEFQYFCEHGELPQEEAVEKKEGPENQEPSQSNAVKEKGEGDEVVEEEEKGSHRDEAPAPSQKRTFDIETYRQICTDLGINESPFSDELHIDGQPVEFAQRLAPLLVQYEYFEAKKKQYKKLCVDYQGTYKEHLDKAEKILEENLEKNPLAVSIDECGVKEAAELSKKIEDNRRDQFNAQQHYLRFKTQAAFAYALAHRPNFQGDFASVARFSQTPSYTLLLPDSDSAIHEVVSFRPFDRNSVLPPITRSQLIIENEKEHVRDLGDRFIQAFDARKEYDEAQAAAQQPAPPPPT